MQVTDIVSRAAVKSGVSSSFNLNEVPEDVMARGSDILRNEIIDEINCDATLDITEVVYPATPKNNLIILRSTPMDYENIIIGIVDYTYNQLRAKEHFTNSGMGVDAYYYPVIRQLLSDWGYATPGMPTTIGTQTDKWPCDQFGNHLPIYCWTADNKLVNLSIPSSTTADLDDELLDARYNIPFNPMRVTDVVRAGDGAVLDYVHTTELVSAEFRHSQLIYGVENHPDIVKIRFTSSYGCEPVYIVLPIPIKVVNSYDEPEPWMGTIIAPAKFRPYLIASLAYRLAGEYGVNTEEKMLKLASTAYNALLKNQSKKFHGQDIARKINQYLERNRGWRTGVNGSGYSGGFYG